MTRCCICGKFMSDDQVLLGMSRDLDEGGQEFAHEECVNKNSPRPIMAEGDGWD